MKKRLTIAALMIMLTGCTTNTTTNDNISSESSNDSSTETTESTNSEDNVTSTEETSSNEEATSEATTITFGDTITSTSDAVEIDGNKVIVTEAGEYTLTGSSEDANVEFDLGEDDDLVINLDNLNLTASTDAPIYIAEGKNVEINLIGESSLEDSESNQQMQAPIFIDEVETVIQGDGTLNLTGNAQEGFENNNEMTIESGTLNITAMDDGINTGDGLIINGGTINIDCDGDGLDSNGFLEINGGTMIVSGGNNGNGPLDYGENAEDYFELNGGTLISAGGNMGVSPTENNQNYMATTSSGSTISVDGVEYDMSKSFSYFFLSTPDLTEDTVIEVDGSEVSVEMNTSSSSMGAGSMGGGSMGGEMMNPPTQF